MLQGCEGWLVGSCSVGVGLRGERVGSCESGTVLLSDVVVGS